MTTMFDYSKAILKAIKENPNNRGKKIEHCTLRLEMPLSKSNSYQFPLLDSDQKTAALTERRLSADDQFVPFAMALKHLLNAVVFLCVLQLRSTTGLCAAMQHKSKLKKTRVWT